MAKLNLTNIVDELKKKYSNYTNSPFIQKYNQKINQPIYNATNAILNRGANIPRFQVSRDLIGKAIPATKTPVGQFVTGAALAIPESIANIPRNLIVGYSRLQKENMDQMKAVTGGQKRSVNFQNIAAGVAPLAEAGLDVASFGTASNIAKAGGKEVLKRGVGNAFKKGAVSGGLYGGVGGLAYGVGEQYNKKFNVGEVAGSTLMGASLGGLLGGTVGGLGAIKRLVKYDKDVLLQLRNARGQWMKGTNPIKPPGMSQAQWDFQIKFNKTWNRNPYEPVFSSDLQQAIKVEAEKRAPALQVRDINKDKIRGTLPTSAQQPIGDTTKGVENTLGATQRQGLPTKVSEILPSFSVRKQQQPLSQMPQKLRINRSQSEETLDTIISQGRKQIGGRKEEPITSFKQSVDNLYTQWVDRYNPIVKASQKAKGTLRLKGALLRPEHDPEYLVRRLTGAGGIADQKFRTELEPVLKQVEKAGIPKIDMDAYLANKRISGFGKIGRGVYGADPQQASKIVVALETKYPQIKQFADQLYNYQNGGFQEMVDAGFISPENAKIIQSQNPDYAPLKRVMDEIDNYLGLPTRKTMQGSQPIKKLKGSTRLIESPLESIIGNTFSQRAAIEKNRVAKSIVGLQEIAPELGFLRVKEASENTITIWKNGQKEYWNVGKDIADVAKGVNEEAMNLVLKVLQAPASLLRQGATGRNPEFMIPNIVRDQLDAGVTSRYGYIPFIDYVSGLQSMVTNDDVYKKWAGSGAKIDLGEMSGKKSIQNYFDSATHKKKLFGWVGRALDVMGKYSEQPTRVGLFKKAYKKTGNELMAALESRDATVDFARMGSKMKVANSIVPFLNVGIQGFDKLMRSIKNNPAKVLFNATLYGTVPAVTTTVYNLLNHPKEYFEIPQYEKDGNFVLVTGRNEDGTVDYVTFPKGNVLPVITNPAQSFVSYLFGNDQQSFKEMALTTLSSALPVIGDGQSLQEIGLKTVGSNLPQVFKPITENILNKSFYKYDPKKEQTKDIVPFYLQDEDPYKQTYKFTPQMYQKIGQLFNVSPLKVQNIMEGYLAGYSKIPAQVVEMMYKTSKGEAISPNEKTILRRFIKQTYPSSGTKAKIETSTTPSVMERLGLVTKASEETGNIITYTKDGEDNEVDLNKTFEYPTLDASTAIGKEAISRYKSEISTQINKIYDAYKDGAITQEVASEKINTLSIAYDKTKKAKKPKKIALKVTKYKAPKITLKKKTTLKLPTLKVKKPKKIKIVRRYTIR